MTLILVAFLCILLQQFEQHVQSHRQETESRTSAPQSSPSVPKGLQGVMALEPAQILKNVIAQLEVCTNFCNP